MHRLAVWLTLVYIAVAVGVNVTLTGAAGSVARLAFIPLFFFWLVTKFERPTIRKFALFITMFIVFFCWQAMTVMWARDQESAYSGLHRYLVIFLSIAIIWDTLKTSEEVSMGLQAYVVGTYVTAASLFKNFLYGRPYIDQGRYNADGFHPNGTAILLAIGMIVAWSLYISPQRSHWLWRTANFLFPIAALTGIIITGSRGGAVAAIPGVILILVTLIRKPFGLPVLAAGMVMAFGFVAARPEITYNLDRIATVTTSHENDGFTGRTLLWDTAIDIWKRHPIIGVGVGGYPMAGAEYGINIAGERQTQMGAHSAYLSVLSESGIIGLTLYLLCFIAAIASILQIRGTMKYGLLAAGFAILVSSYHEHNMYAQFLWFFFMLAVCYRYRTIPESKSEPLAATPEPPLPAPYPLHARR